MSLTFEEKNKSSKVFNLITEAFWSSWYSWLVHDSFLFVFYVFVYKVSFFLLYICCRGGSGSIWPRNFGRRSKHIHKVDTALKAGDKRLFSIYLWSPARYTAMFLVFGISTFGVMLYLCSVNPNTGKSILKFNTVYSKNKLFNHRKGKKRHLSWQIIINFYIHLCLHLISPSLPFFFLVLDSWLMAQVTETSNDPNSVVQINHTHLCWIKKKK